MASQPHLAPQANDILRRIKSLRIKTARSNSTAPDLYFIPRHVLARDLNPGRIKTLLDYVGVLGVSCDTIHDEYLAVFATLITIKQTKFITCFVRYQELTDEHMPFHDKNVWDEECSEFFEEFRNAQWEFCAQEFRTGRLDNKRLHLNKILPIVRRGCLKRDPDSTVEEIEIHPDYNCLGVEGANSTESSNKFILKSYDKENEALYYNEIKAYKLFKQSDIADNVVCMYGSWTQDRTHSILLEFVEGGTLADLFSSPHPTSSLDRLNFWTNLLRVLEPLGRIHQHTHPDDPRRLVEGVHQDVKPANILVCKSNAKFPYDYTFKLVDMGLTYFDLEAAHEGKYLKKDGRGTQTYSAPECFRDERDDYDEHSPRGAHPSKDIWSLGCVFSFALVWSVLGPTKVEEYQRSLRHATARVSWLRDTAYMGCFHDGERVLDEVRLMHNQVLRASGRSDQIISDMVSIITNMLDEISEGRPTAKLVRRQCQKALQRAEDLIATERVSFPNAFLTEDESRTQPRTPPEVPDKSDRRGLGIHVRPQSSFVASCPEPAEQSSSSASGSPRHSTDPYSKHNSIDTMISTGSPISTNRPTSGRLSGQNLEPIRGTPPASPGSLFQNSPSEGFPSHTPYTMNTQLPYRNGTIPTMDSAGLTIRNGKSSTGQPNPQVNGAAHTSQRLPHVSVTQPQVGTKPHATIEEVFVAIQKKKSGLYCGSILRDLQNLSSLNDRDQIFLIDNSKSMKQHWPQVRKAFEALAYIAKYADPDGIELYFTNWTKSARSKDRKKLLQLFESVTFPGQGGIEPALSKILDESTREHLLTSLVKKKRAVNIYVLTDGIWTGEKDSLCGIDEAIKQTVTNMNTRNSIGIQFIQFGNDPAGTHRLQTLDDGLKDQNIMDIIDHTHVDGNVFKMFLGSIDTSWDGQPVGAILAPRSQNPSDNILNGDPF